MSTGLKGGFAKCYELIDTSNGDIFAGKVIAKSQLTKPDQKSKVCIDAIAYGILAIRYAMIAINAIIDNRLTPLDDSRDRNPPLD